MEKKPEISIQIEINDQLPHLLLETIEKTAFKLEIINIMIT